MTGLTPLYCNRWNLYYHRGVRPHGLRARKGARPPLPALPADLLYGRLLATAAQHVLGGGPAPRGAGALGRRDAASRCRWTAGSARRRGRRGGAGARRAPVLDLGCGPGPASRRAAASGKVALGVDLSPVAVRLARRRGGAAIPGDVFGAVPWAGALADGAAAGRQRRHRRRARRAAAADARAAGAGGAALVELDPPGAPTVRTRVRIEARRGQRVVPVGARRRRRDRAARGAAPGSPVEDASAPAGAGSRGCGGHGGRPARSSRRSAARRCAGPWLTAALGTVLLVLVAIVAATGFLSHVAYSPDLRGNAIVPAARTCR